MSVPSHDTIRTAIDALLEARADDLTVCPSEVARALRPDGDWHALMGPVREVAAVEAAAGRLRVTRGGKPVDARRPGGPIRLARRRGG